MAIGLGTAGVIAAGASLLGTAGSAVSQGKLNKKTRKWNEKMWHAQNAYNLPEAQMQRFKDAGLNPNLIYGQGNSGNAGAAPSWSPQAPDMSGVGGAVDKYFNAAVKEGQIEKMRTENAILATQLESGRLDLDVKKKLTDVVVPAASGNGVDVEPVNMLFEGSLAGLQEKRYRAERQRVASVIDKKSAQAKVDYTTHKALNEAARTGLIKAHTANTISQEQLRELDKRIRKYEADFLDNFDLRHTDLSRMLMQAVPVILSKILGK